MQTLNADFPEMQMVGCCPFAMEPSRNKKSEIRTNAAANVVQIAKKKQFGDYWDKTKEQSKT